MLQLEHPKRQDIEQRDMNKTAVCILAHHVVILIREVPVDPTDRVKAFADTRTPTDTSSSLQLTVPGIQHDRKVNRPCEKMTWTDQMTLRPRCWDMID